ncbi:hypothetical protein [Nocardia wallacei]|uniref:hypothetical protein n=1 Tax=Nocardia wallacei TaxID=480035 RepID=UPI002453C06B|nr:hypothetical protein [Nocardia wallacei]
MQNITIGRYRPGDLVVVRDEGDGRVQEIADAYAGWIEGVRDDGSTWIMYLDAAGNPEIYWGRRDEDGGVIGDGILLA